MSRSWNVLKTASVLLMMTFASAAIADTESHKALVTSSIEIWSTGDLANIDQVFLDTYKNHQEPDVAGGPKTVDLAEWASTVKAYHASFPDTKTEILLQFGDGEYVTTRWRFEAVQKGEYLGLQPTGKTISWTGIQIDRFEEGKISETWVNWDMYSMFRQLGIIKSQ